MLTIKRKLKSRGGFRRSGRTERFSFLSFFLPLFISEKGSAICVWFRDTSEAGSAPGEQKANLVCSSKGC